MATISGIATGVEDTLFDSIPLTVPPSKRTQQLAVVAPVAVVNGKNT